MLPEVSNYLKKLKASHDEDAVDRINYVYTPSLLLIFSLLLTAKQYVGDSLQCWVPHQFKDGWEKYVEKHCFIENTYFTKINESIPASQRERQNRELAYYQWLPVMLILEAALCYAPRLVWKILNKSSGLNLTNFIPMSMITRKSGANKELKTGTDLFKPLADHFEKHIKLSRKHKSIKFGVYVTILYLVVKVLFLLNIVAQFVVLDLFLGPEYTFWGIGIILDLLHGRHWKESGHFPRVTLCDVQVRELGNLHNWTVQCVLMVNMFAEKIFIFLWFWFGFFGIITLLNLIYWILVTFVPSQSRKFVQKYLDFNDIKNGSDMNVTIFIKKTLRLDGITILRLMSDNSGDLAVADIIGRLWVNVGPKPESSGSTSLVTDESDTGYLEKEALLKDDIKTAL